MKKYLLGLIAVSLCGACEQRIETPAGGGDGKDTTIVTPGEKKEGDTTIVNPPAVEKKEENTTIINPAPAPANKTESSTTIVNPPAPSAETTTEKSSTTTTTTP